MQQTIWSFDILGFRVLVRMPFLLIALFVPYLSGVRDPLAVLGWMAVIFVSIVVHELGHAITARSFGFRVGAIELHGMGGHVTHAPTARARSTPQRQLAISLAGPGAGLLVGTITLLLWSAFPSTSALLGQIIVAILWVNIGWSLFNLLPALPLDGGNALRSALAMFTSERNAWRITAVSTLLVGVAGAAWALTRGQIFLTFFGAYLAYQGYQIYQQT